MLVIECYMVESLQDGPQCFPSPGIIPTLVYLSPTLY